MSIIIPSAINHLFYLERNKNEVTVEFKVWGNCTMCKARIEKSLKVKGVKKAKWNMDTRMLTVVYNPKIISLEKIHERLASAGHDTEELYTTKRKYSKLPECCRYMRDK
jgi:copper chaperone CopZ